MRKRASFWDHIEEWIIVIAVLLILVFVVIILRGKLGSVIEFLKNLVTK